MKFLGLILLIGVYGSIGTASISMPEGDYVWLTDDGILKDVSTKNDTAHINLSKMMIKSIEPKAFSNVKNKLSLNLANNEFEVLPPLIFSGVTNVEKLSLANNTIHSLKGAFDGIVNLTELDLSNSKDVLQRGELFGLTNFTRIIVNDLSAISTGVFQNSSDPATDAQFEEITDLTRIKHLNYLLKSERYFDPNPLIPNYFGIIIQKKDDGSLTAIKEMKLDDLSHSVNTIEINLSTHSLILHSLDIKKFQSNWFQLPGTYVRGIEFYNNLITDITPELFNELPSNILIIDLQYNKISIIKKNIIDNRYLREIILAGNSISKIEDDAFEKTKLTSLNFVNTGLKNLSFIKTLPKTIEELRLNMNGIEDIPVDTFRGLENLETIDLRSNNLEEIEQGTFESQKNLVRLLLSTNKFKKLDSKIFKDLNAKIIMFSDNQITKISQDTFTEISNSNLEEINLSNNNINTIEGKSFHDLNITRIDLSLNNLTEQSLATDAFNGSKLRELILDNNLFKKISSESFSGILEPYRLSLEGNQIATIEKGDAKYLKNVRRLHLTGNPLKKLKNGALYGLSKDEDVLVYIEKLPITIIPRGLFNDV